jgi:hypothetical protein
MMCMVLMNLKLQSFGMKKKFNFNPYKKSSANFYIQRLPTKNVKFETFYELEIL